jgi:hypothetical protein
MTTNKEALPLRSLGALLSCRRRLTLARELVVLILSSRCAMLTMNLISVTTTEGRCLCERIVTPLIDGKEHGVERRCTFTGGIMCWDFHYASGILERRTYVWGRDYLCV